MKTFLCVYLGALVASLFATPIVARIARAINIVDAPGVRKVHVSAVPRIGGAAIVVAMLALIIPVLALHNVIGDAFREIQLQIIVLLAASVLMFLVGLVDDICGLRAGKKLLAQVIAAAVVCAFGIRIDSVTVSTWFTVDFGVLAWPITIFWIVGITNAVNLIDGLDGLAAGISAVACGVIMVFAIYTGQVVMAVLMLALLGSLSGFLFFNFNPAKIFMGDCGSMFLGFVLATSSVMCAVKSATLVGLALPALALGVPIFDTLFSMVRRIIERRSMFSPDRGHIHHKLLARGLRQRQAVIVMYLMTLVAAGVGMFMMVTRDVWTVVVFACVVLFLMLMFGQIGQVSIGQNIAALHRNRAIARQARQEVRNFENSQLKVREADMFDNWWEAVCSAGKEMDFVWLALALDNRDGSIRTLVWRREGCDLALHEMVSITFPLHQRRKGPPLQIEASVRINGSLESAGHRVGLFGRLIEEYSLANLSSVPRSQQWSSQTGRAVFAGESVQKARRWSNS